MAKAFQWDQSKFDATLKRYLVKTSRTLPDAINKKAYYVVRKSIWFTRKVLPERIKYELEASEMTNLVQLKSGRYSKNKKNRSYAFGQTKQNPNTPRIFKILIARLRNSGKPIPPVEELQRMALKMLGARIRSVAYVKSGWIGARDILRRAFKGGTKGLPPSEGGVKRYGQLKGAALVAEVGFKPFAKIWNDTPERTKRGDKMKIYSVGVEGLQKAFDSETEDMIRYLEGEMKEDAKAFNDAQK